MARGWRKDSVRPQLRDPYSEGAKPAELRVMQQTRFEPVINLRTAKTLGLMFPRHCSPAPIR
jgi:hypothetical protein